MNRPEEHEFAPHFAGYIALVPEDHILPVLVDQVNEVRFLAAAIPPERETYRYAPGKWTIREIIGHVTDGERVFGHRAFCIARGEQASLPSFDEQAYMAESNYCDRPLAELVEEFAALRGVNLAFLRSLPPEAWKRRGTANGVSVTVTALAYILAGHARHHLVVLRDRYGAPAVPA
ncbi:MAG: DinB family protein [Candidatus Eisenbacteria bacterium]